jgi:hypothetical protein
MKKLIFSVIASVLVFNFTFGQSELTSSEVELITNFISSNDYKSNIFLSSKKFDTSKGKISYSEDNLKIPKIFLPLYDDTNKLIGSLEIIKKRTSNIKLPNDNQYFVMYRDYKSFDFSSLSGTVKMYDNNYDNYLFNTIEYNNGKSTSYSYTKCPTSILKEYETIISYNENFLEQKRYNGLCDGNHNGNLSFSECYFCFNGSCASNPECYTLCYGLGDVVGWVSPAPGFPMCQASIAVACVYLAAAY